MAELVGADSGTASSTLPLHRRVSTVACQRSHVRVSEFELLASIKEEIGVSQLSVDEPNLSGVCAVCDPTCPL